MHEHRFYRFVDRDMFWRYLGGAPGHTRLGSTSESGEVHIESEEPMSDSEELDPIAEASTSAGPTQMELVEEELQDWYLRDSDSEDEGPHAGMEYDDLEE